METRRYTNAALEGLLGQEVRVLDHGFIRVIDYMGGDESIVQAARVSYGSGTKKTREDRALIRYLMRHRHTTPFEMCEIKFHIKLPIFVARQWIRHRTANVNEYSARYSILDNEFFIPEHLAEQSSINKQGRERRLAKGAEIERIKEIEEHSKDSYRLYSRLLHLDETGNYVESKDKGIARELARIVLPTNFYTQWFWKIDLHNLFHFLSLRSDPHAQEEIRAYAKQIANIVKIWSPLAFEAFEDYLRNSITFSAAEMGILRAKLNDPSREIDLTILSDRERKEFESKLGL